MIGAIADDFTGGTDVAVAFRRAGLNTLLFFGVPDDARTLPDHDAVVIAMKTRTSRVVDAVADSVAAARWLRAHGADQLYFKYCSTFDSRPEGNIGPVADALAALTGAGTAVVVPSSPEHGRTQYMGHLFVGSTLLSDSPMRHHPLTPMTCSSVPQLLAPQTRRAIRLVDLMTVRAGRDTLRRAILEGGARSYVVVDAMDAADLRTIGQAVVDAPLVTGAAGLAGGLAAARIERRGRASAQHPPPPEFALDDAAAVLAGSCSARTLEQIDVMQRRGHRALHIAAVQNVDADAIAADALEWWDRHGGTGSLIYSSLPPEELLAVHELLGADAASATLEDAMGRIAVGLRERGVRRIVVAGGETSGAVVQALGVDGATIGQEAAPGVPWIRTIGDDSMTLLLKSGNFGDPELLADAVGGDLVGMVA